MGTLMGQPAKLEEVVSLMTPGHKETSVDVPPMSKVITSS